MLLNGVVGVVIFLEFFAIKTFLKKGLDYGALDMEVRLRSVNTDEVSTQKIFLTTNGFYQHLPQLCLEAL